MPAVICNKFDPPSFGSLETGVSLLSGLKILLPLKPGPKDVIQILSLNPCGTLGLGTKGLPAHVFSGSNPPQAEANNDGPNGKTSQTKEIITMNGEVIKMSNGGNKIYTISFMSLNSTLVDNQEPSPEEGTGPQPNPKTTTLEQDN
ncbi:hypothetical protein DSO57_1035855 [Entomophthora muscae]|uniref:Uncharacterized protein n=1 Tax=Entomophthora muscae TaxID=34485 RepID=A0ACC2RQF5_9FUNG|nr:hypothetical protein DSO57_1035855 [Entomophthora muscae]